MTSLALKTLFHPFETEALAPPAPGTSVLFLGAEPGFRLPEGFSAEITAVSGFRPNFLALQREGRKAVPQAEGAAYGAALVLASRHRGESELRLAEAVGRVTPGGMIVVAGGKEDGIGSLRKRLSELVGIDGHLSKHHGVAFWFARPHDSISLIGVLRDGNDGDLIDGRFRTAPGMFSAGGVDRGSKLLADHLPADIKGKVADFCSGWGYLAARISDLPNIAALDLYEADFASLEASKLNLAGSAVPTLFFWQDLASEDVTERYDAIVMNPPFHTSRQAEPQIGQALITAAATALKRGGRLFIVANRQLPYEKTLAAAFHRHEQIFGDGLYKIFVALR